MGVLSADVLGLYIPGFKSRSVDPVSIKIDRFRDAPIENRPNQNSYNNKHLAK